MGKDRDLLEGMNEITEHMGKSAPTILKWFDKFGFPMRRVSRVWQARVSEIEAWAQDWKVDLYGKGADIEGSLFREWVKRNSGRFKGEVFKDIHVDGLAAKLQCSPITLMGLISNYPDCPVKRLGDDKSTKWRLRVDLNRLELWLAQHELLHHAAPSARKWGGESIL